MEIMVGGMNVYCRDGHNGLRLGNDGQIAHPEEIIVRRVKTDAKVDEDRRW